MKSRRLIAVLMILVTLCTCETAYANEDQFDIINYMISKYNYTVEIAEGNTAFELVNNQLVRK